MEHPERDGIKAPLNDGLEIKVTKEVTWTKLDTRNDMERFEIFSLYDQIDDEIEYEWLIDDLIPLRHPTIIYGEKGSYKTLLGLHIALCLSSGMNVCGLDSKTSKVLLLALEGSNDVMPRAKAHMENYGYPTESNFYYSNPPFAFGNPALETILRHEIEDKGINVLIVDTLSQASPKGSFNDDGLARIITRSLAKYSEEWGITTLSIGHTGKDSSKGLVGSKVFQNDVPCILKVKSKKVIVEKQRSGSSGAIYPFTVHEQQINEKGQTAIWLEWDDQKMKPRHRMIIQALETLSKEYTDGVPKKELKKEVWQIDPKADPNKTDSFRTQFNRDINELAKQSEIQIVSDGLIKRNKRNNTTD